MKRLVVLLISLSMILLTGCAIDNRYSSIKERIDADLVRVANATDGVVAVETNVNSHTSGTYITLVIDVESTDREDLGDVLKEVLKPSVEALDYVNDGSFMMMVRSSSNKEIYVNPSDVGFSGGRLSDYRDALGLPDPK